MNSDEIFQCKILPHRWDINQRRFNIAHVMEGASFASYKQELTVEDAIPH